MKELMLLRHAKSSWDDPGLGDAERPLAPRGRRAAPRMGRELVRRGWFPDYALVSPARRAQQTWRLVAAEFSRINVAVGSGEGLYMATPEQLLRAVHKAPPEAGRVVLVGHNPGMEAFASLLAGRGSEEDALERLHEKFPTAAVARFAFDGGWDALSFGQARLLDFLKPRDFG